MISNYEKQVDIGRGYFLQYDQEKLITKYGLEADESYLYVTYLAQRCRIKRDSGRVDMLTENGYRECRSYTVVMTIYDILCHNKEEAAPYYAGDWTPVGNFAAAGASPDANWATDPYAWLFLGKTEAVQKACEKLGGRILPRLAGADVTADIPVFSFFHVLVQFWDGDEEFPPKVQLLWDRRTLAYMHFETTYYLQGDLLDRMKELMGLGEGDKR